MRTVGGDENHQGGRTPALRHGQGSEAGSCRRTISSGPPVPAERDSAITLVDLPADLRMHPQPVYGSATLLSESLAGREKHCILNTLAHSGGERTRVAECLGISRKNLWKKMQLHAIEF